ncbi:MAG: transposase [Gammaproteobacteria bacterium]|nr:transposase [Gammaproteobacteria bacterium]
MPRKPRCDFPGAVHHVVSRGVRRREIYRSVADRLHWLNTLGEACDLHELTCYAYCMMDNHYHLLVASHAGKLSRGIQLLNSHYAQHFNAAHEYVGHVFQRRFHSEVVDRDAYLLEAIRYVLLNPVRAQMVEHPGQWRWSSFAETIGEVPSPPWLATDKVHGFLGLTEESAEKDLTRFLLAGLGTQEGVKGGARGTQEGSDP